MSDVLVALANEADAGQAPPSSGDSTVVASQRNIPAERPAKVPQPNEEAFKKELEELEAKLKKTRNRLEEIRQKLNKRGSARDGQKEERDAIRKRLQDAQALRQAKEAERAVVKEKIEAFQKQRKAKVRFLWL